MNDPVAKAPRPAPELLKRVISAAILLPVLLLVTFAGGKWFVAFCGLAACIACWEFAQVARLSLPRGFSTAMLAAVAATVMAWFAGGPLVAFQVMLASLAVLALGHVALQGKLWAPAGVAYAALPFLALALLRGDTQKGLHAILFVFACVIAADTFAYFAGRAIGGPKLAPVISPKKTWSGFAGGIAGSVLVGLAMLVLSGYFPGPSAALFAAGLSLASQMGDLFESWIKRRFGKKDSGAMIPGHGGLLDRIDGMIFAAVTAWLMAIAYGGTAFDPGQSGATLLDAMLMP